MVQKYHVPLLAIPFSVWRMGPVSVDVYEELSDQPLLLEEFVTLKSTGKGNIVKPKVKFDEGALPTGAAVYAYAAMRWLEEHGSK